MLVIRNVVLTSTLLLSTVAIPTGTEGASPGGPFAAHERNYLSANAQDAHAAGTIEQARHDLEIFGSRSSSSEQPIPSPHKTIPEFIKRAGPQPDVSQSLTMEVRIHRVQKGNGAKVTQNHQDFVLPFDSISPMSFIVGVNCGEDCRKYRRKYDPRLNKASTDLQTEFTVIPAGSFGGTVKGTLAIDNFQGVKHKFGVALGYPASFYPGGVVSLNYQPSSASDRALNSFVWGLKEAGKIASAQVTIPSMLVAESSDDSAQGTFTRVVFGSHPLSRTTLLASVRVMAMHDNLWKIPGSLSVDGKPIPSMVFVVSTGSPFISIPSQTARSFYDNVHGAMPADDDVSGRYIVPCGKLEFPPVELSIGQAQLVLQPERLALDLSNDGNAARCYGALVGSNDASVSEIGSAILGQYTLNLNMETGTVALYES